MPIEVALPVAYAVSMAGFFAWVGRRNGFWWVAVPLLLGICLSLGVITLWNNKSTFSTPMAFATVVLPAVIAYVNRATGYRWWPSFSVDRRILITWLILGTVLVIGSVGVLVAVAAFNR